MSDIRRRQLKKAAEKVLLFFGLMALMMVPGSSETIPIAAQATLVHMDDAMVALTAVAGVSFSVAIALLVEEVVMGGMFRLMFARAQAQSRKPGQKENEYVAD